MLLINWWEQFKKIMVRLTQPHKRQRLERYGFPLALLILVYVIKSLFLAPFLELGTPYLMSTFIVILSSWYGGLGPGILATILAGILSNFLFLEPKYSFIGIGNALATIIFFLQGLFISMISEAKRYADIQKDEFISFASHELKNPLTVLKTYNRLIQKIAKNNRIIEYANKNDMYIDKIASLTNELLDISKIESGKLSLNKEYIEIYKLVQSLIQDQQLVSKTHKIKLIGTTKSKVYADKIRISQVIINMLTNAIKYSPGKKMVEVSIADKKNFVIISVRDYGIGLSKKEQSKVFERFYRAQDVESQGLGLGLYISKQIAQLHNAKLWVKSTKGKGSTFYLQMPRK